MTKLENSKKSIRAKPKGQYGSKREGAGMKKGTKIKRAIET